ncbi:MAG: response regulator, partial [Fulvivirga sp.]
MERSVLIVEDEPLIADDLLYHLEDIGISTIEVALKYEEALEKIQNTQFDLALLDVNLSGNRDGIDLANFIKRQQSLPFIFITSYYDQDTLNRAKETDPLAYILKPF